MTHENPLGDAVLRLLELMRHSPSEEERKLLEIASGAAAFLSFTGQLYRFEDFRESRTPSPVRSLPLAGVTQSLERMRTRTSSSEEKDLLGVALDALDFIASSGQHEALEDYLRYWRRGTLPPVIAAFKTREEADAWLEAQPAPPYMARVLIGGEYHSVQASRRNRDWPFAHLPLVAEFIEKQSHDGLPPVEAAFDTREQAEAWLEGIPEPARHTFITIGGEHYLAACWKNVNHRALYPFALVEELAKERRARMQRLGLSEEDAE